MMLVVVMLALAAPNPRVIDQPRRNFADCIKQYEKKSLADKVDPAVYASAIKSACPAEAAALTQALVTYDVAMGGKRAAATVNAASDLADYIVTSEERYRASSPK